jgi:hypothetical protein
MTFSGPSIAPYTLRVIASEAKQSMLPRKEWIASVASLLAMTADISIGGSDR